MPLNLSSLRDVHGTRRMGVPKEAASVHLSSTGRRCPKPDTASMYDEYIYDEQRMGKIHPYSRGKIRLGLQAVLTAAYFDIFAE
jgi:hypothetical protein